jgi:hypothetical protein
MMHDSEALQATHGRGTVPRTSCSVFTLYYMASP